MSTTNPATPACLLVFTAAPRGKNKPTSPLWASTGTRLGPYEINSPLGAGGMGEVYRARDTRLNRDVAIKVLPDAFASDGEAHGPLPAAEALAMASQIAEALAYAHEGNDIADKQGSGSCSNWLPEKFFGSGFLSFLPFSLNWVMCAVSQAFKCWHDSPSSRPLGRF